MKGTFSRSDQFWFLSKKAGESLLFSRRQRLTLHPKMFPIFFMLHYPQHLLIQTSHPNAHAWECCASKKNSFLVCRNPFFPIHFQMDFSCFWNPLRYHQIKDIFLSHWLSDREPSTGTVQKLSHSVAKRCQEHHLTVRSRRTLTPFPDCVCGWQKPRTSSCRKSHTLYFFSWFSGRKYNEEGRGPTLGI